MAEVLTRAPILVLGIGNILLRDEGVGVRVVQAMESMALPGGVELLDGGTAGADLLDAISDRRKLIVVDALDADVPPGTIVRIMPGDLVVDTAAAISLHEVGIAETLRMARQLSCGPREVTIIGVRPKDLEPGLELSPEMERWLPRIIEIVRSEITVRE